MILKAVLVIVISYLIGSIPFGFIVGKVGYGVDIRDKGSGNIGFTNIFRILGVFPGIVVLAGDVSKGVLAVLLARLFFPHPLTSLVDGVVVVLASMAVILGHNWSIYLKFSGGRGIATGLGVLLVLVNPYIVLILFSVWLLVLLVFRYVSLASISIAVLFPFLTLVFHSSNYPYILFSIVASLVVIFKHGSNIKRLLKGAEPKTGQTSSRGAS